MLIRYKKDFYNRRIERVIPKRIIDLFINRYMEYKHNKVDLALSGEIDRAIQTSDASTPIWIEIETVSRCNGGCSFCHIHAGADPRPLIQMTEELFKKIISDLEAINYDGSIALFCNNEAFMDKHILERMAYVKEKLPNCYQFLFTNGIQLTPEKFVEMMKYLDILIIDNYSDDGLRIPSVSRVYQKYMFKYDNAHIWMRRKTEVLNSRGGTAPNRKKLSKPLISGCVIPFQHMSIRPDGKVNLCCQDALWKHPPLGDLTTQTVMEVWNGTSFIELRQYFRDRKPRAGHDICKDCDFITVGRNFQMFIDGE